MIYMSSTSKFFFEIPVNILFSVIAHLINFAIVPRKEKLAELTEKLAEKLAE